MKIMQRALAGLLLASCVLGQDDVCEDEDACLTHSNFLVPDATCDGVGAYFCHVSYELFGLDMGDIVRNCCKEICGLCDLNVVRMDFDTVGCVSGAGLNRAQCTFQDGYDSSYNSYTNSLPHGCIETNATGHDGIIYWNSSRNYYGRAEESSAPLCNIQIIDCQWTPWTQSCKDPLMGANLTCGTGVQTRSKTVVQANGGTCLEGGIEAVGTRSCDTNVICPIHGDWGQWDACDVNCGGGTQSRACDDPDPEHGGDQCLNEDGDFALSESRDCGMQDCPVHGNWSAWGDCDQGCGDGMRSRTCDDPAPNQYGNDCYGFDEEACNLGECDSCADDDAALQAVMGQPCAMYASVCAWVAAAQQHCPLTCGICGPSMDLVDQEWGTNSCTTGGVPLTFLECSSAGDFGTSYTNWSFDDYPAGCFETPEGTIDWNGASPGKGVKECKDDGMIVDENDNCVEATCSNVADAQTTRNWTDCTSSSTGASFCQDKHAETDVSGEECEATAEACWGMLNGKPVQEAARSACTNSSIGAGTHRLYTGLPGDRPPKSYTELESDCGAVGWENGYMAQAGKGALSRCEATGNNLPLLDGDDPDSDSDESFDDVPDHESSNCSAYDNEGDCGGDDGYGGVCVWVEKCEWDVDYSDECDVFDSACGTVFRPVCCDTNTSDCGNAATDTGLVGAVDAGIDEFFGTGYDWGQHGDYGRGTDEGDVTMGNLAQVMGDSLSPAVCGMLLQSVVETSAANARSKRPAATSGGIDTCSCNYIGTRTTLDVQFLCQGGSRNNVCYNLIDDWCDESETICSIPV